MSASYEYIYTVPRKVLRATVMMTVNSMPNIDAILEMSGYAVTGDDVM